MSKLEINAESFSLVKFSVSWKALKTGSFADQEPQKGMPLFSLLFSLCDFEKTENEKYRWYHWLKLGLVARTGIEPVFQP
jgi:hypothetical protein